MARAPCDESSQRGTKRSTQASSRKVFCSSSSILTLKGRKEKKQKRKEKKNSKMSNCFVYGTLMAEEVLKCLIKRVPEQKPGERGARVAGNQEREERRSTRKTRAQCPHRPRPLETAKTPHSSNHGLPQARAQEAGLPGDSVRY